MSKKNNAAWLRNQYADKRAKYVAMLGGVCVDCGTNSELEFDHVDRTTKKFVITSALRVETQELLDELAKCVLRCKSCHLSRTKTQVTVGHGGGLAGKRKCPCEICKESRKLYMREWRNRQTPLT